jgi:hypothetical protein
MASWLHGLAGAQGHPVPGTGQHTPKHARMHARTHCACRQHSSPAHERGRGATVAGTRRLASASLTSHNHARVPRTTSSGTRTMAACIKFTPPNWQPGSGSGPAPHSPHSASPAHWQLGAQGGLHHSVPYTNTKAASSPKPFLAAPALHTCAAPNTGFFFVCRARHS